MPVLIAATGGVVDFTSYQQQRKALQNAVDSAALAAAKEATLQGWDKKTAQQVAENYLEANLLGELGTRTFRAEAQTNEKTRTIKVDVALDHFPFFYARMFPTPQIEVTATAVSS